MTRTKDAAVRIHAWFDSAALDHAAQPEDVLARAVDAGWTALVVYPGNAVKYTAGLPEAMLRVLDVADAAEWAAVTEQGLVPQGDERANWVVSGADHEVLAEARRAGIATCLRMSAHDQDSLLVAIEHGRAHRFLAMRFPDPTNIPLELVIASLQGSETIVIKEITDGSDGDDAVVCLGVMEVGSEGVLFSPTESAPLERFAEALRAAAEPRVEIQVATVVRSVPIGMGNRSCIDLAGLFEPTEGMLIGSTSSGGILCCPEVFFLPYMELRPFRVNAGAVHSYVYASGNRTNYLTELRAGSPAMIVGLDGRTREVPVGRIKTEVRPLRLIEAEFANGDRVNVIMQDDWHVRVFSPEGEPQNITHLKPGDRVLAHPAVPGRHVGIPVDETIQEA